MLLLAVLGALSCALPSQVVQLHHSAARPDAWFDQPPAHWARAGGEEVLSLSADALLGEFFTFQAGIFAPGPA